MKARKKKAAKRAAKRTTEITEKVAANAEDKKAEVVDSTEKTAAAQDTTKKEVKAEPAKEEKKPEVKAEPVKEEKKTEAKVEPVKEEKKPEVKAEPVKEEKKTEARVEPVKEEKKPEVKAEPVKKETEKAESTKELEQEFERRMARHYDELKWLYCELYENRMDMFEDLCKNLKNIYMDRKPDLKKQDRVREQNPEWYKKNDILGMMMYVNAFAGNLKGVKEKLDYVQECNVNYLHLMPLLESPEGKSDGGYAVSDFRKVQPELGTMEDLESLADECRKKGISLCMDFVMNNMLNLTNKGIDVIRIDAVPYIWKQLGTNCRNLPQVHNIVRMMRMICEIVCPGVLLLGEVVMEPEKVVPYFGSVEKPECHMLYNVTTMATTWNTVATRDARLLRQQMDIINRLPKDYVFLNYLRCHDDIGWGLDYGWLGQFGIDEVAHKKYLSDFFTGNYENSFARGELYNADPTSGDARQCGTTASLCGIEKAAYERDEEATKRAIRYDLTLHVYMLTQSGIPVIYSGDEIGQENDYTYHENPKKWDDSRYLHRGDFRWDKAELRHTKGTIPGEMFEGLDKLEKIRKSHPVFESTADCRTVDTWDDSILGLIKEKDGEKLVALFNFSEYDKVAWINEEDGMYEDLISGRQMEARGVQIPAFGCYWLLKK